MFLLNIHWGDDSVVWLLNKHGFRAGAGVFGYTAGAVTFARLRLQP